MIYVFSKEQYNLKESINKKLGRSFTPGIVLTNGRRKQFTGRFNSIDDCRFPDAIIVGSGKDILISKEK